MMSAYAERSEPSAVSGLFLSNRGNNRSFAMLKASGKRFLRFNLVGAIGVAVQLALLTVLTRCFGLHYLWATGVAVSVTVWHNFAWHERFTFYDRVSDRAARTASAIAARFVKFNLLTGVISIGGNILLMHWLRGHLRLPLTAAALLAIGVCGLFNYMANDCFVFRRASDKIRP